MRAAWLVLVAACGGKPAATRDDAKVTPRPRDAAVALDLPARPLGLADLTSFDWRHRGGQAAFRAARKAEAREDWPAVAVACKQALAADPSHLEAAWLLAAASAKLGKLDDVLAPLQVAASGDYGKWDDEAMKSKLGGMLPPGLM